MAQYIDKSALVAEIERLQDAIKATAIDGRISKEQAEAYKVCVKLRFFVEDTLEVKEVYEIPARIEVNKYHNRFISSWAGLCQYDNFHIGEEIKILLPKNKAQKRE